LAQDYNVILALSMFYAILTLLGNLLMDIAYALVDPRVKLEA
jgi:peptide/nickel transport system permease protein